MTDRPRVIGLGRAGAGDDGVGPAVLEELRRRGAADVLDLIDASDPTELLTLVETGAPAIVVDAAVGGTAGEVRVLDLEALPAGTRGPSSTHGIGAGEVLRLARQTAPERVAPAIAIVAVLIPEPIALRPAALSAEVAAAVARAADTVLDLVATLSRPRTAQGPVRLPR